jgi:Tfp pilus assembly protein PilF
MESRQIDTPQKNGWSTSQTTIVGILLIVTWICYFNSIANGFVYDDRQQILQNPYVKNWNFLREIFTTTVWSFVGDAGLTNYYRPLMTLTFLILWKLFGPVPAEFHLVSVGLHSVAVLLVYFLGERLSADKRVGFVAALLFAVHPVHTEAVSWIAAITDLEMTLFFLLAIWVFSNDSASRWKNRIAVGVLFLLATLSKEPGLTLLPVTVFFEFYVRPDSKQHGLKARISHCSTLLTVTVLYLALRLMLFGKFAPVLQHPQISWRQAVYSGLASVTQYAALLLWPTHLSAFHVFKATTSFWNAQVLAGCLLVGAGVLGAAVMKRRAPWVAFCIVWLGLTLAPVLNARWMAANVVTERYLYLPSAAFCWLAAGLFIRVWDQISKWSARAGSLKLACTATMGLLGAGSIVIGTAQTIQRNRDWRSDLTLYSRTLQTDPAADIIRSNLAEIYFEEGDLARAEDEWKKALAGKPDNVLTMNGLGVLYTQQKHFSQAEAMFRNAIAAKPLWGEAHYRYAILLHQEKRENEAENEFRAAIAHSPLNSQAHLAYGKALLDLGNLEAAELQLKASLELDLSPEAESALADLYLQQGKTKMAETLLRSVVVDQPFDGAAHLRLGHLLESFGRAGEAMNEYKAVLRTDPQNTEAKNAIARLKVTAGGTQGY